MTMGERAVRYFPCAKCGGINPDFLTFGVGRGRLARHYCLRHIPWWVRVRVWLRERLVRS